MKNETNSPGFLAAVWLCTSTWLSLSNGMWEDMICTTSSLCLEGEGHANLFPFSSWHELECQDPGQPSWTIRCRSWVRTNQQAKVPTMTFEVLCDPAIPKLSDLHWSVHYRNTDCSLCCFPQVKYSLLPEGFCIAENSPHMSIPSLSPGLYSNTTFPVRYSDHFVKNFNSIPSPQFFQLPHLLYFSP